MKREMATLLKRYKAALKRGNRFLAANLLSQKAKLLKRSGSNPRPAGGARARSTNAKSRMATAGRRSTGKAKKAARRRPACGARPRTAPLRRRLVLLRSRDGGRWAFLDRLARKVLIISRGEIGQLARRAAGLLVKKNPGNAVPRELAGKGWIVVGEIADNPAALSPAAQLAANVVQRFNAAAPRSVSQVNFHQPRALARLGEAVAVVYRSGKFSGRPTLYRHGFTRGTELLADERGRGQLYIKGRKLAVSARGIMH